MGSQQVIEAASNVEHTGFGEDFSISQVTIKNSEKNWSKLK